MTAPEHREVPAIDPHWVPPEHHDSAERLVLRLPREEDWLTALLTPHVNHHSLTLDSSGVEIDGLHVPLDQLKGFGVQWDTLRIRGRESEARLPVQMTGRELSELCRALEQVVARLRSGDTPVWRLDEPLQPQAPSSDAAQETVDPRWIAPWSRSDLIDRLHIRFPSEHSHAYLRLRQHDIAFPVGGRLMVRPLDAVRRIRTRAERVEILFDDAHWSRVARMRAEERQALVRAIRAFVHRNASEETPPPEALLTMLTDGDTRTDST